jgi:sulfoquinovosidase
MRRIVIALVSLGLMVSISLAQETDLPPRLDGIVLTEAIDATTASRGAFTINWDSEALRVLHAEQVVWSTPPGGFLAAANGTETVEEVRGNFFFTETRERVCTMQTLDALTTADDAVVLSGTLSDSDGLCTEYSLRFDATGDHTLRFDLQFTDSTYNRAFLEVATNADERFYGFGMQFSFVDLKGQRVPVWVSEQGIGRGAEPITTGANIVARSGGTPFTTYAPIPHYLTSQSRSLMLETTVYNVFDLTSDDRLQIEVWDAGFSGQIIAGETPADLIREYTGLVGRMRPLPEWLTTGAVVGMQGGTERVREIYEELQTHEVPISAFWLQDWVGRRTTSFGEQLWWNWVLDRERYPDWDALVSDFNADGIQVLTYASPFITDAAEKPDVTRNLYAEAVENGYFVTRPDGTPYATLVTDFDAALVDLTNPAARDWLKSILLEEVLGVGAVGYMADFGEALPHDAILQAGTGAELHNS